MSDCLNKIKNNRKEILTGEIGALLHDIGKLHPNFIKTQSKENIRGLPHHARDIDKFLNTTLLDLIKKNSEFDITINSKNTNIYNLITEHHRFKDEEKEKNVDELVESFFRPCDRKDSADDKGIVRKKQPLADTWVSSPFGHFKEKIDLSCLQKRFEDLENNLIGLFKNYISETMNLTRFRESLIDTIKTSFSHALGETRIPANDVTLWDHSYSTASLFKSVLAAMSCGYNLNHESIKWRIFGICWNGIDFINKGRKIAEIQARARIFEDIKRKLKRKFEDEIPIGNAIYEDTNGIYFTFPDLVDKSKNLAKECAKIALETVYNESNNEIWPSFTLSKASSTLTIIANELKFASEKRKIPKMTPVLFVKGNEECFFENPKIVTPSEGQDVCPICRIRPKDKDDERCEVCEERRKGRLSQWLSNRKDTIWTDEVADINNRIALISLSFSLDKWLDGTMMETIYSQSFEDWMDKEKENLYKLQNELKDGIKKRIERLESDIEVMKKAKDQSRVKDRINKKTREKKELEQKIKHLTFILRPNKETAYEILYVFFEMKDKDKEIAAKILNTFFEENIGLNKNTLENRLHNIKGHIDIDEGSLTKENLALATYLFTQNPSPARLYRIWKETEEFFDLLIREFEDKIYSNKWKRIKFSVNYSDLKLKEEKNVEETAPYIIRMDNLEPQNILVFHNKNGEFYTIESLEKFRFNNKTGPNSGCKLERSLSLEKFRFNNKTGEEAVKEALSQQGLEYIALEDKPDKNLLKNPIEPNKIKIKEKETEEYYPLIEINKSPLSLRLIVPALDSIKIIELIKKLYNERFERVLGKLPLNVKLLVAKRKFPLYMLLDAENRMLEEEEFKKQKPMNPWWNIDGMRDDSYYGHYPTKSIDENKKYTLDDLSTISRGKIFHLYPGYIDFDLLLGTIDRYNIYYEETKRGDKDYKLYTGRPYYFYEISEMLELWDTLSSNLSTSQINFIEEMLTSKLREWRNVEDGNRQNIFRGFAETILKDAFGNTWSGLRDETKYFLINSALNSLLLDTIILFKHIINRDFQNEG